MTTCVCVRKSRKRVDLGGTHDEKDHTRVFKERWKQIVTLCVSALTHRQTPRGHSKSGMHRSVPEVCLADGVNAST